MEDLLIETLNPLGYPVIRQGSLGENEKYPETFFTFWNNSMDDDGFYDNTESKTEWNYTVSLYSCRADVMFSKFMEAKSLLRQAGFMIRTAHDVGSDETTHIGKGFEVIYVERK